MRRLADQLSVGTMTLYGYFRNKGDLLDAAVDLAAREFVAPPRRGGPRRRMETYMHAVYDWLVRHPSLVHVRARQPIVRPAAYGISEIGMQTLLDGGLAPADAALAFRTLFNFVFGSVAFGLDQPASGSLPGGEFPALAAGVSAGLSGPGTARREFDYGVSRILDGLGIG
jgi:AcrR family transcriptional regulator